MSVDTYKYFTYPAGRSVSIDSGAQHTPSAFINIDGESKSAWGWIPKEDVPALALALLEAAGYTGDDEYSINTPEGAVRVLRRHAADAAKAAEQAAAKAREAEQLDEEALDLFNAFRTERRLSAYVKIEDISGAQDAWREVAKKARELHGGAK